MTPRSCIHLSVVVLAVVAGAVAGGTAQAQIGPRVTTSAVENACAFAGHPRLEASVVIYDRPTGGRAIARFAGVQSELRVDDFPVGSARSRVRVRTGSGAGSFRIDGYLEASQVPLRTARRVAVVPGYVWINAQQAVDFQAATADRLEVSKRFLSQVFTGTAPCEAFTLVPAPPPAWDVPGDARGYSIARDRVDLFSSPGSSQARVYTLRNATGMLFWSTQRQGDWVRLRHHREVVVDAWARVKDLEALPVGETQDVVPSPSLRPTTRLKLANVLREVTTTRAIDLRTAAAESAAPVGVIEPNTTTAILDVVAGWASVLPESLHVAPVGEGHFWVPAGDLGLED